MKSKVSSGNSRWAANDLQRMPGAVEEVRVAEGDVRHARLHLLANVLQHHLGRHDEEAPAVDRRDGAVRTQVQTTSAGLDVPRHPPLAVVLQFGVMLRRWQAARNGSGKRSRPRYGVGRLPRRMTPAMGPVSPISRASARLAGRLALAADAGVGQALQEIVRVQGGIKPRRSRCRRWG